MVFLLVNRGNLLMAMALLAIAAAPTPLYALTTPAEQVSAAPSSQTTPVYLILPFTLLIFSHALLPAIPWTRKAYNHFGTRLLIAAAAIVATLAFTWLQNTPESAAPITILNHLDIPAFLSFIIIIASLYTIAGNIRFRCRRKPTPWANLGLLSLGVLLAGVIGNIPAALIMIFPILDLNASRKYARHTIIFFIITVANTGGALLPTGDAALLYQYTHTISPPTLAFYLWPCWLAINIALLIIYLIVDTVFWRIEKERLAVQNTPQTQPAPTGGYNIFWLLLAVAFILLKHVNVAKLLSLNITPPPAYFFDIMLLVLAALSLLTTPPNIRRENLFTKTILTEAALFYLALFITAGSALAALPNLITPDRISAPWQLFWITGAIAGILDNTAVIAVWGRNLPAQTSNALIPLAVVFFGALTYIGNGANFTIKSLADRAGIPMPGFFGYFLWSALIVLPVMAALTIVQVCITGLWAT